MRLLLEFPTLKTYRSKTKESKLLVDYDRWRFTSVVSDWVNIKTGELSTGYQLNDELKSILTHNLDLVLE